MGLASCINLILSVGSQMEYPLHNQVKLVICIVWIKGEILKLCYSTQMHVVINPEISRYLRC